MKNKIVIGVCLAVVVAIGGYCFRLYAQNEQLRTQLMEQSKKWTAQDVEKATYQSRTERLNRANADFEAYKIQEGIDSNARKLQEIQDQMNFERTQRDMQEARDKLNKSMSKW